jgi:hypothetical protein
VSASTTALSCGWPGYRSPRSTTWVRAPPYLPQSRGAGAPTTPRRHQRPPSGLAARRTIHRPVGARGAERRCAKPGRGRREPPREEAGRRHHADAPERLAETDRPTPPRCLPPTDADVSRLQLSQSRGRAEKFCRRPGAPETERSLPQLTTPLRAGVQRALSVDYPGGVTCVLQPGGGPTPLW